jgi:RimJ/RimL family protein N-acetyltransferase
MNAALGLRPAGPEDAEVLLALRNDPAARAASFHAAEIAPEEHAAWLAGRLADPGTRLYVAEFGGAPVGQARVDTVADGVGEISVALDAAHRGRGLGRALVAAASARAAVELGLARVEAAIKLSNEASVSAFRAAGYSGDRRIARGGEEAWLLVWTPAGASP